MNRVSSRLLALGYAKPDREKEEKAEKKRIEKERKERVEKADKERVEKSKLAKDKNEYIETWRQGKIVEKEDKERIEKEKLLSDIKSIYQDIKNKFPNIDQKIKTNIKIKLNELYRY
jgi:reticulocyte-binding protein